MAASCARDLPSSARCSSSALLVCVLLGCRTPEPEPELALQGDLGNLHAPPPIVQPLRVHVEPPTPTARFRWEAETSGLVTALFEAALLDLEGVSADVGGRASPGVERAPGAVPEWRATLQLDVGAAGAPADALVVGVTLCSPDGPCALLSAPATRGEPWLAISPLMADVSAELGRRSVAGASTAWAAPVSSDTYAVLIAGRSAATFYGLLPPVPANRQGDSRADSITRAVFIDPSASIAQWLLGRREAAEGRWGSAQQAFTAASGGRRFHPGFAADEAVALAASGRPGAAAVAFDGIVAVLGEDGRFVLSRAEALIDAGRLDDAWNLSERLVETWPRSPVVSGLRVRIADARGDEARLDALLAAWVIAEPGSAQPVRRQIFRRIHERDWEAAWLLLPELEERGARDEARSLRMSLGIAVKKYDLAALAAEQAGLVQVAADIRARAVQESL